MNFKPAMGRHAALRLALESLCRERAVLIQVHQSLLEKADASARAMEFGRATVRSLAAEDGKRQIADLTERISAIQAELDEPEADFVIPFRPRVTLAEQHAAVDDMAGLVAA